VPVFEVSDEEMRRAYLTILHLPRAIITIHDGLQAALKRLVEQFSGSRRFRGKTPVAVLYQILDRIEDHDMILSMDIRSGVDDLEEWLDEQEEPEDLAVRVRRLSRRAARMGTIVEDQMRCVAELRSLQSEAFDLGGCWFFGTKAGSTKERFLLSRPFDGRLKGWREM